MPDLDAPPDTDALDPGTPAPVTREEAALVQGPPTLCLNCGARLPGRFCPRCGQKSQTLRVPVHRFVFGALQELFGLDGRVWRTYGTLLFRPGRLTVNYFKGRRQRSLSPLRVYIASTLLFFLLLSVLDPVGRLRDTFDPSVDGRHPDSLVVVSAELARAERELALADSAAATFDADRAAAEVAARITTALETRADSLEAARTLAAAESLATVATGDDRLAALDDVADARRELSFALQDRADAIEDAAEDAADLDVPSADDRLRLRVEAGILGALPPDSTVRLGDLGAARAEIVPEVNGRVDLPEWVPRSPATERFVRARDSREQADALTDIGRDALSKLPTSLFLLLPVFALLLKVLYVRRGWYYSEHLVFGLHVHAVAFVALSAMVVVSTLAGGGIASSGSAVGGVVVSALGLYVPAYFLMASKRVYGQGWLKTMTKSVILGFVYVLCLLVLGLLLTLALALVTR